MNIIGVHGPAKSGKDTLAKMLEAKLCFNNPPLRCYTLPFALPLKEEVARMLMFMEGVEEFPAAQWEELLQQKIDYINEHKDNFRLILQGWGTDYRRKLCNENYWVNKWERKLNFVRLTHKYNVILVPDVRFHNEVEKIHKLGGNVIKIVRNSVERMKHDSETEIADEYFDAIVPNNHELKDLEIQAEIVLHKLGYK